MTTISLRLEGAAAEHLAKQRNKSAYIRDLIEQSTALNPSRQTELGSCLLDAASVELENTITRLEKKTDAIKKKTKKTRAAARDQPPPEGRRPKIFLARGRHLSARCIECDLILYRYATVKNPRHLLAHDLIEHIEHEHGRDELSPREHASMIRFTAAETVQIKAELAAKREALK